jgi:hypothetical protein
MIYAHLAGIDSLQDLENCTGMLGGEANHLNINGSTKRSFLSDRNKNRPYTVFEEFFFALCEIVYPA